MKKTVALVALAAFAALPAVSSANGTGTAETRHGGNLRITFDLRTVGGELERVEDFRFKRFIVSCAVGGPVKVKGYIPRMSINDAGKFDGNAKDGNAKVHVEGDFKSNGKDVEGTLKASGDFGVGAENCDTKVAWEGTVSD